MWPASGKSPRRLSLGAVASLHVQVVTTVGEPAKGIVALRVDAPDQVRFERVITLRNDNR